jgi:ectoine hydroxylase
MRFTPVEAAHYAEEGWLLRERVFAEWELVALREAAEETVAAVREHALAPGGGPEFRIGDGHRLQLSKATIVQWEWREGSQEVRLLEPVSQLHPRFGALWDDPRFVVPFCDALGVPAVAPFTCKLNLKRPREGSEFPWHQDYPYWYVRTPEHAHEIATAILFLDAADAGNGGLRVLPGSHRNGPAPRDRAEPTRYLADAARFDASRERLVEAPAGSLLFFGSLLLHRSTPNTSERPRRALLLSFQPAGRLRQEALPFQPHRVEELP